MIWKLTDECWWADQMTASDQLQGAKAIICVADNLDIDPNCYPVPFYRIPFADNAPLDVAWVGLALAAMQFCLARGVVPFVIMCRAGQSRSPSFAALWLCWREGISYPAAMKRVRAVRADVFPWERTWRQLEEYSSHL